MKTLLIIAGITIYNIGTVNASLISNGSFEDQSSPPTFLSQLHLATPWQSVNSADLFHPSSPSGLNSVPTNIAGYQVPHDGDSYVGFYTYDSRGLDYRESPQAPLNSPLIAGEEYEISFYASLHDASRYASNIEVYFSQGAVSGSLFTFQPQVVSPGGIITDSVNWTLFSDTFIAEGGENYITIGNFSNDANTIPIDLRPEAVNFHSYYLIDSVSLNSVSTAVVPIPSSAFLFISGLFSMFMYTKNKSNKALNMDAAKATAPVS